MGPGASEERSGLARPTTTGLGEPRSPPTCRNPWGSRKTSPARPQLAAPASLRFPSPAAVVEGSLYFTDWHVQF